MTNPHDAVLARICDAIHQHQRFVITSHARPDGDAIGSELAMAYALRALGKTVRLVNADPVPAMLREFPGIHDVEVATTFDGDAEVAIVMECGSLARTGVSGLERFFVINIDHHPGNTGYGDLNWFDESAAACGELVFTLIEALGVPFSPEIATHIYVTILTDTGAFHFSHITPRTFDICRRALDAGVDPVLVAQRVYDSNTMGRLRLLGTVLNDMETAVDGRIAILSLDPEISRRTGATAEDTEGLINVPLTVHGIVAVAFLKLVKPGELRVSFRSKGTVDVGTIARGFGGGGHLNASGCTVAMAADELKPIIIEQLAQAIADSDGTARVH
ncbi:MAG TPA: bifunctional oligoribonuclease/PAP phosphatase NrnA [Vicinamibacterales bacterium]|jgi:phosphoesterase RecJ-like protein